jgi:hypothetical protein
VTARSAASPGAASPRRRIPVLPGVLERRQPRGGDREGGGRGPDRGTGTAPPMMSDDDRAAGEVCVLARARLDGIHGCLDAPTDALAPCTRYPVPAWCANPGTPAATVVATAADDPSAWSRNT